MSIDEDMSPAQAGLVLAAQREEAYARGLREGLKAPVTIHVKAYTPTGEPVVLDKDEFDVVDGATVCINMSETPRCRRDI